MATLATGTDLTLAELVNREDPNGQMAQLVDVISETNKIVQDATWIECNDGTKHEDTRTLTEPSGTERLYDEGVTREAGRTEPVIEPVCMLDGLSVVDAAKLRHTPDELASRLMEDQFFLRGMSKTFCTRLFDGNRTTNARQINGINSSVRDYAALSSDYTYDNAGGAASVTANKTSMYIIQWGMKKVNLIYPRNDPNGDMRYGIKMEDFGKDLIADRNVGTKSYPAWRTWFECHFGIFIHDPRCIKRVVNISTTNIDSVDDFSFNEDYLIDAVVDLEYDGDGAVIYCNRTVMGQIWKRAKDKANVNFTVDRDPFGKPIAMFQTIPIKRVDKITSVQATIS